MNQIEQEQYAKLSKINRVFGYMGWELTDFRYGKDIRLYGAKDMMVNKWRNYSATFVEMWGELSHKLISLRLLLMIVDVIRDFGIYLYVGVLAIWGRISIGVTTQMFTAAGTFYNSMRNLVMGYQDLCKRTHYANEYYFCNNVL